MCYFSSVLWGSWMMGCRSAAEAHAGRGSPLIIQPVSGSVGPGAQLCDSWCFAQHALQYASNTELRLRLFVTGLVMRYCHQKPWDIGQRTLFLWMTVFSEEMGVRLWGGHSIIPKVHTVPFCGSKISWALGPRLRELLRPDVRNSLMIGSSSVEGGDTTNI